MMLAGRNGTQGAKEDYTKKLDAFFSRFPRVEEFRISQENRLRKHGFVTSMFGNRRCRVGEGELSYREKRWALNHPVQSTASLVFKEALLAIAREVGEEHIILPMHDAVLLEFKDDDNFKLNVERAEAAMTNAFGQRLPSIRPRITKGSFADG